MLHLQYIYEGQDVTGDPCRMPDADQVRLWQEDGTLLGAVERRADSHWYSSASDVADWAFWSDAAYPDWRLALELLLAGHRYEIPES